ncbi:MAG TPA: Asp-tRNA(Asn)/Glu-tRNA(Gln) amidotransferase subunit GatA [Ignavibacteria bacterium]|nr:Asp-tRNA(Asn)/Glu-tRNA(Gln) amidotransferase subunit GatA [Ignavibacteria bacterium]
MQNIPQSYKEIKSLLNAGDLSCEILVNKYLENINAQQDLNVFISLFEKDSIKRAKEIDEKIKAGNAGKLAGAVFTIKDVISVKDKLLTCGSKFLSNFETVYNATVVERLLNEDAIIIGKVNCDEFAMGSSNENSYFGLVKNSIDKTRVPGGSSGASAVSVAANMCLMSLGSETGGSIRQPASFCGITGLKATYGRISRFGLVAFASSFDSIGIFGSNSYDIGIALEVISGYDYMDSTSSEHEVLNYAERSEERFDPEAVRIGYVKEYFEEGLSDDIRKGINERLESLRQKGFKVKEISLPSSKYVIQTYYILTCAEASSNLSRFDGVRYGVRAEDSGSVEEMYVNSRSEGFGDEVKRRIMLGTYVLSAGYYDAYYRKGQKARQLIMKDFENAFSEVDYIISPTTPTTAFKIGEKVEDPLAMYLNDIYTVSANLAGIPAISVPAGKDSNGLPFGIQIMGKKFDEEGLLRMGNEIN